MGFSPMGFFYWSTVVTQYNNGDTWFLHPTTWAPWAYAVYGTDPGLCLLILVTRKNDRKPLALVKRLLRKAKPGIATKHSAADFEQLNNEIVLAMDTLSEPEDDVVLATYRRWRRQAHAF